MLSKKSSTPSHFLTFSSKKITPHTGCKNVHIIVRVCYKAADFLYISALYLNVESGILQAFAAAEPVILPARHR